MFRNFGYKLSTFMMGRNGVDDLSKFQMILFCILWVILSVIISLFPKLHLLNLILYVFIIYIIYRIFSKNTSKRQQENQKYLDIQYKVINFYRIKKSRMEKRRTNKLFKCPSCHQILSVPKGKGKIKITCPKCKHTFIKRS